ncbi:unnamed protein product [Arabis nemorensis]|uniref:Uncharacterized protein n=1 Tax=Arabis nemorensis TaxID=586526 RepID=A0A565AYU6_9BRAS|nr:unnamed protein product [Arabis nemorensis]
MPWLRSGLLIDRAWAQDVWCHRGWPIDGVTRLWKSRVGPLRHPISRPKVVVGPWSTEGWRSGLVTASSTVVAMAAVALSTALG